MSDIVINHLIEENKFSCALDGAEAVLKYSLDTSVNPSHIDFYSTFVPPEFRGKGVAEKLVRTGLAWAKQQHFHVTASCWYAAKFIKNN